MTTSVCPFVWHDLITTDTAAAKTFYAQVFGWNMQAFPGENEYTVVSAGSIGVGGIMPIPAQASERGAPACWQGYIAVPDVDIWAARIQAKGGTSIQPPQDIPNVGRFALFPRCLKGIADNVDSLVDGQFLPNRLIDRYLDHRCHLIIPFQIPQPISSESA